MQAMLLARIDGLSIWYRPEPRTSAVARRATSSERLLASIIDQYLMVIVNGASLSYSRTIEQQSMAFEITIESFPEQQDSVSPCVEFRIHTPQFYRQMITFSSLNEYLSHVLLGASEENRTAWSADASSLICLVRNAESLKPAQDGGWGDGEAAGIWWLIWATYRRLRSSKKLIGAYPHSGTPKARAVAYTMPFQHTDTCFLDGFVRRSCPKVVQLQYMLATLSLQWRSTIFGIIGGE